MDTHHDSQPSMAEQMPLDQIIAHLRDPNSSVVLSAVQALERIGEEVPLEPLLALLNHSSRSIIQATIHLLGTESIAARLPLEPLFQFYEANRWPLKSIRVLQLLQKMRSCVPLTFWLKALQSNDREIVFEAAQTLGQMHEQLDLAPLLADVGERYWALRVHAVNILDLLESERSCEPLLQALLDEAPEVSCDAARSLEFAANTLPESPLQEALHASSFWVREHAWNIMANRLSPPPTSFLLAGLHDPHECVRTAAIRAIARWPEVAPLEELINAVDTDSFEEGLAAVKALGKVGILQPDMALKGVFKALLNPHIPLGNPEVTCALEALTPLVAPDLCLQAMDAFYQAGQHPQALAVASSVQRCSKSMPVHQLKEGLHSSDHTWRTLSILALGGAGATAPIEALIGLLDEAKEVRMPAIGTLLALYEYVSAEVFLRLLRDPQTSAREYTWILQAVCEHKKPLPHDILLEALQGRGLDSEEVIVPYLVSLETLPPIAPDILIVGLAQALLQKRSLSEMLGRVRMQLPFEEVLRGLTHASSQIREGTLILLADYPEEVPLDTLLALLDDPHHSVNWETTKYICHRVRPLPIQSLLQRVSPDTAEAAMIIEACGTLGNAAPLDAVLPFLQNPDPQMRVTALDALRQPGLIERVPTELLLNRLDDEWSMVREAALEALKDKDQDLAIVHCIDALSDSEFQVYWTACEILQQICPAIVPDILAEARALIAGGKPGRFFRSLSMVFLADVIGYMGQAVPACIAQLSELLNWPSWRVRVHAVYALGRLRNTLPAVIVQQLRALHADPHSQAVRKAAHTVLQGMKHG